MYNTRYKTRQQLQAMLNDCIANSKWVALVSLVIGALLGKLS